MKRIDLVRHLEEHGVKLLREGSNHTVYVNRTTGKPRRFHATEKLTSFWPEKSVKILKSPPHNSSQA